MSLPSSTTTRRALYAAAALIAVDALRLAMLPERFQTPFQDGFEAVVAAACAVACALAAARSRRFARARWAFVTAFFAVLATADLHDLLVGVSPALTLPVPRALELVGWCTYLPLAFLVVFPIEDDDARSPWSWLSVLDFLQVALVAAIAFFHYIYLAHVLSNEPWTTRLRVDDVRNVLLSAGLLLRAGFDPSPCARRFYVRLGGCFGVLTLAQALFTGPLVVAQYLLRPAALMALGVLAVSWSEPPAETAPSRRRHSGVLGWVLGLLPATGPVLVLALATEAPPGYVPALNVAFVASIAVFVVRVGLAERQRQSSARLWSAVQALVEEGDALEALPALCAALHRRVADLIGTRSLAVALQDPSTKSLVYPYRAGEPPFDLVESVLRTGEPLLLSGWLGVPLKTGDAPFGSLLVTDRAGRSRLGPRERDALAFLARHVAPVLQRKQAEEALRASEKRYRSLLESAADAIVGVGASGEINLMNSEAERMFGYERSELIGRPIEVLVPENHRHRHAADREAFAQRPALRQMGRGRELSGRRRDGTEFPAEISLTPVATERGLTVTAIIRDVSERRTAERTIRSQQATYRTLVEHLAEGVFLKDGAKRYLAVNRRYCELLGLAEAELLGRTDLELFPLEVAAPRVEEDDRVLTLGERVEREEIVGSEAQSRTLRMVRAPVLDDRGAITGVLGITYDVTEQRRLEAQLRQAQKMEAIGQLAGGVAHDFNNLLTVIGGYSDLLVAAVPDDGPLLSWAREIQIAGARAASLTGQLLAFSRKQSLLLVPVDLSSLVAEAQRLVRPLIGERIQLATEHAPDLRPVVADPTQLQQVFFNLAVNARDAMPDGGTLTVRTANVRVEKPDPVRSPGLPAGEWVLLAMSDDGAGMTPEVRARIFEPFFTTKEVGRGTGLGLAVVYGVIKQLRGYVFVDSAPGRGTAFRIYLPPAPPQPEPEPAEVEPPAPAPAEGRSATILLVEDEASVRELVRLALLDSGYAVLEAPSGPAALEVAGSHAGPIDLLLTDVVMPMMSGSVLARRLKAQRPDLRILFVSGYADGAVGREGLLDGGAALLRKPFTTAELRTRVRDAIGC